MACSSDHRLMSDTSVQKRLSGIEAKNKSHNFSHHAVYFHDKYVSVVIQFESCTDEDRLVPTTVQVTESTRVSTLQDAIFSTYSIYLYNSIRC